MNNSHAERLDTAEARVSGRRHDLRVYQVDHNALSEPRFGRLFGQSQKIREVYRQIDKASRVEVPVLIIGETGTGKELVAREIHERSSRAENLFIAVHMGSLTTDLIASELFGHVRGAFTGATETKQGCYEAADRGTLFLDEVGTMEERTQIALLRLIETGMYRPVGSQQDKSADVRIIAATNSELHEAVANHQFREDLLHRFEVFPINLPPLRERMEDIPLLVDHFLQIAHDEMHCPVEGIDPEAMAALRTYRWPGNLRELKNVIAHAAVLADGGMITEDLLPDRVRHGEIELPRANVGLHDGGAATASKRQTEKCGIVRSGDGLYVPVGCRLDDIQRAFVLLTLEQCANNKTQAARMLGLSRKTLYERLRRWNIRE